MNNVTKRLTALFKLIQEEAEQNEVFRQKLERFLGESKPKLVKKEKPQAKLDPVKLAIDKVLDEASLFNLTEQELKDIILVYKMNPKGKKLKAREAFVSMIIETAYQRATRGDAFLE